ncbi:hypothetical protein BDV06DRAFT_209816 [Aspergillus oleicola]
MFNSTRALRVAYTGISLETLNMEAGKAWSSTVYNAGESIEKKFPAVVEGRIQRTKPHPSSKDRSDSKDVVTVGYYTANGTRYLSIHAHEDGTWTEFFSRAGRSVSAARAKKDAE